MPIDHSFGDALLPKTLRRVRSDEHGVRLDVDTETHDTGLLRSIAEAVRTDEEAVGVLVRYAEIRNALDEIENGSAPNNPAARAALEDEAANCLHDLDRSMEWQSVGEGLPVRVDRADTEALAGHLVYAVAEQIANETGAVAEIHANRFHSTIGGAA